MLARVLLLFSLAAAQESPVVSVVLKDGTILFNGSVDLKKLGGGVEVPIIGGTGAYDGAGGTVKMGMPTPKTTSLEFEVLVPTKAK